MREIVKPCTQTEREGERDRLKTEEQDTVNHTRLEREMLHAFL